MKDNIRTLSNAAKQYAHKCWQLHSVSYQDTFEEKFYELVRAEALEEAAKWFDGKVGQADLRDIVAVIRGLK